MGRPKKVKEKPLKALKEQVMTIDKTEVVIPKEQISLLSIDYPHEYLNAMGRKINQLIEHTNAQILGK